MKKIYYIIIFLLINGVFATVYAQSDYTHLAPVKKSGKWGYINMEGEYVIYPKFQMASDFAEDIATVQINGLWGFIDANGKYVIKPQFDDAYNFSKNLTSEETFLSKFVNGNINFLKELFKNILNFSKDFHCILLIYHF